MLYESRSIHARATAWNKHKKGDWCKHESFIWASLGMIRHRKQHTDTHLRRPSSNAENGVCYVFIKNVWKAPCFPNVHPGQFFTAPTSSTNENAMKGSKCRDYCLKVDYFTGKRFRYRSLSFLLVCHEASHRLWEKEKAFQKCFAQSPTNTHTHTHTYIRRVCGHVARIKVHCLWAANTSLGAGWSRGRLFGANFNNILYFHIHCEGLKPFFSYIRLWIFLFPWGVRRTSWYC